jgi:hypothetical protein
MSFNRSRNSLRGPRRPIEPGRRSAGLIVPVVRPQMIFCLWGILQGVEKGLVDSQSRSEDLILSCNPWRVRPKHGYCRFQNSKAGRFSRLFTQRIRNGQIYMRNNSIFFSNFNQMNLTKLKCGFDEFLAKRRTNYTFWSAKSRPRVLKTVVWAGSF